jgi:hypothetical protein
MKQSIIFARPPDAGQTAQTEEERQRGELIESIARRVVARGLEAPAALFMELHKPLAFLMGQAALAAVPFLGLFFAPEEIERGVRLLGSPEAVEQLITRIEQMSAERACTAAPEPPRPGGRPGRRAEPATENNP